jgi:hypothetical protein
MASVPLDLMSAPQPGAALIATIRANGTASHAYASGAALLDGPEAPRNLADAVHLLCALHGRYPGVIELVATRTIEPAARTWLNETSEAFARERAFLAALAVAAGPVPPTPGAGSEAAVAMQRNAILTLSQSERRGCAIGAALALAGDWAAIRRVLDAAAVRFGVDTALPWRGGDEAGLDELAEALGGAPAVRRAMLFGAEQVALQHRGLWSLLEARQLARDVR